MQKIIKETFPLMPETIMEEIEISVHNIIAEHMVTDRMKCRFGDVPVGEFAKGERIQGYLRGIFSACYMAGFIDGVQHPNNSCDVQETVEHFLETAKDFYMGN